MTSIQEVTDAAHRIGESANGLQQRILLSADSLKKHANQLRVVAHGSRSGMEAASQVDQAEREARESVAQLLSLQSSIDRFIQDVTR